MTLKEGKKVIGFAILSVSIEESHLLNIGLTSSKRGQGLGKELLEKIVIAAEVMGSKKIFLKFEYLMKLRLIYTRQKALKKSD